MNLRRVFLSASLVVASAAAGQAEDFYEARLVAGFQAFRAQRLPEAIDHFRIAAFGLMDRPALLEEALARLALAQEAIGSKEGVAETVKRFVEVERRFGGFAQARLEPSTRTAFSGVLARQVPAETLASVPSLGSAQATPNPPQAAAKEVPATNSPPSGVARPPEPEESPSQAPPKAAAKEVSGTNSPAAGVARPPEPEGSPSQVPTQAAAKEVPGTNSPPSGVARPPEPEESPSQTAAQDASAPPRYRATVPPKYPPAALKDKVGGIVLLRVLVSETGDPLKVEVIRQVRSDLAEAAVSAVQRWTFEPARKDGVPVQASLTIPIAFRISRGPAAPP